MWPLRRRCWSLLPRNDGRFFGEYIGKDREKVLQRRFLFRCLAIVL